MDLKDHIRGIPDFPKKGILFYDISTLISNAEVWQNTIEQMAHLVEPYNPKFLAGVEARGFIVAASLASKINCGLIMVRKAGKLPGQTISHEYDLEYGTDTIEVQADALKPGDSTIVVDDILATGGTMLAATHLLEKVGANVVLNAAMIELSFLNGTEKLTKPFKTLVQYDEYQKS